MCARAAESQQDSEGVVEQEELPMGHGYVYVAINDSIPGYVKIGKTYDLAGRLTTLYASSVPMPFRYYRAALVKDPEWVESRLHETFADRRAPGREFFKTPPIQAAAALELAMLKDVTPNGHSSNGSGDAERPTVRSSRNNFDFDILDIGIDETLHWIDDPAITCTVSSLKPPRVAFRGTVMSLSAAASILKGSSSSLQGTRYWTYRGEMLENRRRRLEQELINQQYS